MGWRRNDGEYQNIEVGHISKSGSKPFVGLCPAFLWITVYLRESYVSNRDLSSLIYQPIAQIAMNTAQKDIFHTLPWAKAFDRIFTSGCPSVYMASFTPTQPTIAKAVVSSVLRDSSPDSQRPRQTCWQVSRTRCRAHHASVPTNKRQRVHEPPRRQSR